MSNFYSVPRKRCRAATYTSIRAYRCHEGLIYRVYNKGFPAEHCIVRKRSMLSTSSVSSFNVLFAWFLYTYIHTYMHACACAYTFLFLIDLRKICFFYSQHLKKKKKKKSDKLSANTHLPEILKDLTNSTPYNVIFYLIHLIFTRTGVHPAPPHEDLHCQPAAASFSTG